MLAEESLPSSLPRATDGVDGTVAVEKEKRRAGKITAPEKQATPGNGKERERLFLRATKLLRRAKTKEECLCAARYLEAITADNYENDVVLWNLGNAYMRAGRPGPAVAAYRRALRYSPREPHLKANLDAAKAQAPGTLPEPPRSWWRQVLFWHDWLSYPEKLYLAAAVWSLVFVCGLFWLYRRTKTRRRAAWFCAVAALVFSLSAALDWYETRLTVHGVVTAECTARKGNDKSRPPAFDRKLREGAEFVCVAERSGWILARFPGIGEGWLPKDCVVTY